MEKLTSRREKLHTWKKEDMQTKITISTGVSKISEKVKVALVVYNENTKSAYRRIQRSSKRKCGKSNQSWSGSQKIKVNTKIQKYVWIVKQR